MAPDQGVAAPAYNPLADGWKLLPERGFNVARALVGTESTCVTILQAELILIANPPARSLLVLGYPDVFTAGDHVPDLLAFGLPFTLEQRTPEEEAARIHASKWRR